ncbi:MAG TPA: hypothetical protein VNI78_10845, partial [Vicinamibacterales bacterium]|nr:hypothetical protein [Vicinamibacterales bacterium]
MHVAEFDGSTASNGVRAQTRRRMATRPAAKPKRIGKSGDDIFIPRIEGGDAERPKRRGRRPSHTEHWTKVTVVLFDRQIVFLDRLGADIRAASG